MFRMSIKKRIVFWYSFSFLLILTVVFVVLFLIGSNAIRNNVKADLASVTDRAAGDVQIVSGEMFIDDDIAYYMDGIYVIIAQEDGTVLSGIAPDGFPEDMDFLADHIRETDPQTHPFYVYDRLIENRQTGKIWIRGMTESSLKAIAPSMHQMLRLFLIALPILCFLVIFGGWYIARQALLPLKKMNETAENIRKSGDLSRRLGFGDASSKDEIQNTAAVIDGMLAQIEQTFASEKRFTNDASHELRTPTAVILAECEYAMEHLSDEKELEESLSVILAQSSKMKKLIDELLMLARADRGVVPIQKAPVDISLIAEESAALMGRQASEKNIRIEVNAPEGCYADGDEALLSRLFENLISNAIKYGKPGGHIQISVARDEGAIRIRVKDDGIGISPEDLPHIWDRFYRVDKTADDESMGLGLSLVQWIVSVHGGTIDVKSKLHAGTEFLICLS